MATTITAMTPTYTTTRDSPTRLRNGKRFPLAVDGGSECCACFGETGRPERTDLIDEVCLRDDSEIVEAGDTVGGHAIVRSEP